MSKFKKVAVVAAVVAASAGAGALISLARVSSAQITKFENNTQASIAVGDIKTGDTLAVKGAVSGATYAVDASNAEVVVVKSKVALENTGVKVGDTLRVFGAVSGNSIAVTRIVDGNASLGRMMR